MEGFDTAFIWIYVGIFALAFLVSGALFFYKAYNSAKLAKMAGYGSAWLAYVPVFDAWLRASVGHESKRRATASIVIRLISFVLVIGALVALLIGFIMLIGSNSDAALQGFIVTMIVGVVALIASGILSVVGRMIVTARIDMAFLEAFEVEAGVATLTVNNFRNGWAYANLLSRIASQLDKGLTYRYEAPAF